MNAPDSPRRLIRALARRVAELVERAGFPRTSLERAGRLVVELAVPVDADDDRAIDREAHRLEAELEAAVHEALAASGAAAPGRTYCLRCGTDECPHARPRTPREVFAGYGPTGIPRFVDLTQLLLDCQDPRVDGLFDESRRAFVSLLLTGDDLARELLPAYRDRERGYQLHAQLAAGWFRVRDAAGQPQAVALSFQVSSLAGRRGTRRFALGMVGMGPEGQSPDRLHDLLVGDTHLREVRWARGVLERIERAANRGARNVERRIEGLLDGLGRRLEHRHRSRGRRTGHAERRHASGQRPTRMALSDLERAAADSLLYDTRRRTIVVLGERGRAHLFNADGLLVTSVRYPPHVIERRRRSGLWRALTGEEVRAIRSRWPVSGDRPAAGAGDDSPVGTDTREP